MSVALFAATDAELARVDRTCWRQFARIKMKRINADHSRIEIDIRIQKISQRLRRDVATSRDRDMRKPGAKNGLVRPVDCNVAQPFAQLKKTRMPGNNADP